MAAKTIDNFRMLQGFSTFDTRVGHYKILSPTLADMLKYFISYFTKYKWFMNNCMNSVQP